MDALELLELLRLTLLPVLGICTSGVGAWILFVLSNEGAHERRPKHPWLKPVGGAILALLGFVMITLGDVNL